MVEKKQKRFRKVTEWNDIAIIMLFASIIILYLCFIFLWSNWDKINGSSYVYGINGSICMVLSLFSIVIIILSIKELKVDEYYEEIE
jgi:uncharacterized membrane protein YbhN (UPF0104 family)